MPYQAILLITSVDLKLCWFLCWRVCAKWRSPEWERRFHFHDYLGSQPNQEDPHSPRGQEIRGPHSGTPAQTFWKWLLHVQEHTGDAHTGIIGTGFSLIIKWIHQVNHLRYHQHVPKIGSRSHSLCEKVRLHKLQRYGTQIPSDYREHHHWCDYKLLKGRVRFYQDVCGRLSNRPL